SSEKNYGLLAAIDWNSAKWAGVSTEEDLKQSEYGLSEDKSVSFTSLNFGHLQFADDQDGYYSGLLPQLLSKPLDREKIGNLKIVFFKTKNPEGKLYIIGFYAFPVFGKGKK